ncbi:hypothetical protein NQZ68_023268 [Dissostichus eleginoides]|nr:hypothetical protein NQZ68_023268 [Dissostichus eleginoides]
MVRESSPAPRSILHEEPLPGLSGNSKHSARALAARDHRLYIGHSDKPNRPIGE